MAGVRESGAPVRPLPAEALVTAQINVGTSASLVVNARLGRRSILLVNHGTVDVFIGADTVTSTTGVLLAGAKGAGIVIPTDQALYAIVASGSQTISFIEIY